MANILLLFLFTDLSLKELILFLKFSNLLIKNVFSSRSPAKNILTAKNTISGIYELRLSNTKKFCKSAAVFWD